MLYLTSVSDIQCGARPVTGNELTVIKITSQEYKIQHKNNSG